MHYVLYFRELSAKVFSKVAILVYTGTSNGTLNFFKDIFGKLDISIAFQTGIHDKLRKLNDFKYQYDQMKTAFNIYLKDF